MSYTIIGLGNPGEEYGGTRHNTGRMALDYFRKKNKFSDWEFDKKLSALTSVGTIGKNKLMLIEPETFMNKSGNIFKSLKTKRSKLGFESVVILHDDLDLPLGAFKISFNKGSGGHRGIESIIRSLKSKAFVRVRIGISSSTPSGKIKKPKGEKNVDDFILGNFKPRELKDLQNVSKKIEKAVSMIVLEGRGHAMNSFN